MLLLDSIRKLKGIEWRRSHNWDLRFKQVPSWLTPPAVFEKWFPATTLDRTLGSLNSYAFNGTVNSYSFPQNRDPHLITISVADTADGVVQEFLESWYEGLFPNGNSVRPLDSATAILTVYETIVVTSFHEIVDFRGNTTVISDRTSKRRDLIVYPEGEVNLPLNSETSPVELSQTFRVVGVGEAESVKFRG